MLGKITLAAIAIAACATAASADSGHRHGSGHGFGHHGGHRSHFDGYRHGGAGSGHQTYGWKGHAGDYKADYKPVKCFLVAEKWGHDWRKVKVCKPVEAFVPGAAIAPPRLGEAPAPAAPALAAPTAVAPVATAPGRVPAPAAASVAASPIAAAPVAGAPIADPSAPPSAEPGPQLADVPAEPVEPPK